MRRVLAFVFVFTIALLIYGLAVDSPAVNYYVPITFVLVGVMAVIHRSAKFSLGTLWALAAIAIGNLAAGVILMNGSPLYELRIIGEMRFDKVFHFTATGVGAWASFEAIGRWSERRRPVLVFAAVLMAAGAGAFVEIVEYIGTLVRENTVVGDYSNNMQDLIANTLGAVLAASAAYKWRRPVSEARVSDKER